MTDKALLVTADGETFHGRSVGHKGTTTGEGVFNTSMTGYQEILTDPSYAGQVVVMTSPHIGNYGVNEADSQSARPAVAGFVMRSLSRRASNWRSQGSLSEMLSENRVVAIADLDTRRLTQHLRDRGAMPVAIGTDVDEVDLREMAASAPSMKGLALASEVSTKVSYRLASDGTSRGLIAAIDLGMKTDILRNLTARHYDVVVLPWDTSPTSILEMSPDGVFVSNGPGDPEPLRETTDTLKGLLGNVPLFGICLGHQVLGLAAGATTFKLPFGHHGGNHPVKRFGDGRVEITSQNHGFAVDLWSLTGQTAPAKSGLADRNLLPEEVTTEYGTVRPTHQNLNDGTLEGLAFDDVMAFSVQYHPESAPGPTDARGLFDQFVYMMERDR